MFLPSSPVVYVNTPGVYFCTVTHDNMEVTSQSIEVVIVPGIIMRKCICYRMKLTVNIVRGKAAAPLLLHTDTSRSTVHSEASK